MKLFVFLRGIERGVEALENQQHDLRRRRDICIDRYTCGTTRLRICSTRLLRRFPRPSGIRSVVLRLFFLSTSCCLSLDLCWKKATRCPVRNYLRFGTFFVSSEILWICRCFGWLVCKRLFLSRWCSSDVCSCPCGITWRFTQFHCAGLADVATSLEVAVFLK